MHYTDFISLLNYVYVCIDLCGWTDLQSYDQSMTHNLLDILYIERDDLLPIKCPKGYWLYPDPQISLCSFANDSFICL